MTERRLYLRLALLVGVVLAGMGLSLGLEPPFFWLAALGLMVVTCVGTGALVRWHPHIHLRNLPYMLTFWILPGLLTLGSTLFLRLVATMPWLALGLIGAGVVLATVVLAEYRTVDQGDPYSSAARLVLNLATYLAAFTLLAVIYDSGARSLQSATASLIVGMLLALGLFRESEAAAGRMWLYASLVGLVLAETTWGLNWWPLSGLAGGVFLLLVFYVVTGIIQSYLAGRLTRGAMAEYGAVSLVGLAFLFSSGLWLS